MTYYNLDFPSIFTVHHCTRVFEIVGITAASKADIVT